MHNNMFLTFKVMQDTEMLNRGHISPEGEQVVWVGIQLPCQSGQGHSTHTPENWGNLLIVPYLRLLESTHTHIHKHKYKQEHKETQTRIQSYESRNCLFISTHLYKGLRINVIMDG